MAKTYTYDLLHIKISYPGWIFFVFWTIKAYITCFMRNQNKLFTDILARLISRLEKTKPGHQIYKPDASGRVNPEVKEYDPHYHDSWELKIPLQGRLHCRFDDQNFDIRQNSALLIAPQTTHYSTLPVDMRHCPVWLNFLFENGDVHLALTKGRRLAHYVLSSDQKSELTALLGHAPNALCENIALALARANKPVAQKMANNWLCLLLAALINAIALPRVSSPQHEIVSRTIALLNNTSYDATITVKRVAKMLNISPKYLSAVFHRLTGVTPRQKLIRIRLERAFRQLQTGKFSVKEVAAFTGWKNQFYFSNSFRRHYGITPSRVPARVDRAYTKSY